MCKTLKLKARFSAPPATIYEMLADSKKRTAFTGRRADLSSKVGGAFSADAGKVTGINVDLVPGKRIVQAWRRSDFPEGVMRCGSWSTARPQRRRASMLAASPFRTSLIARRTAGVIFIGHRHGPGRGGLTCTPGTERHRPR